MINENVEADVMNWLQEHKGGATSQELKGHTGHLESEIVRVLEVYRKEGHVRMSPEGVWTMVRKESQ